MIYDTCLVARRTPLGVADWQYPKTARVECRPLRYTETPHNHNITCTTLTTRTDGLFGFHPNCGFKTISILDNVIECQGRARPLLRSQESNGAVIRNHQLTNVSDTHRYTNPRTDQRAGLEAPRKFVCGVHGEFTLDGWQARLSAK